MQVLRVVAKLWLSNLITVEIDPAEDSKSFSKAPGYCHCVRAFFIYFFVYLFSFGVNKFLLTTVNKNFL